MTNTKCWKPTDENDLADRPIIRIDGNAYALQAATEEEKAEGEASQNEWCVELKYKTQICGPDSPRPYYDWKYEVQSVPFEELIFRDGKCIGIYHEECIILFDDEKTHEQKKWVGEIITGHDQGIDVYYYYSLKRA